ncbi:MAG TPA: hypothetical protein VEQ09_08330 [Aquabacterium sp.]|nr:hypothetical protein [Aquabacterium sp.]
MTESAERGSPAEGDARALSGRISSWRDFSDRVSAAMAMVATDPVDITLSDPDFSHWPLGQRGVMDAFQQWTLAAKGLSCRVLAGSFDAVPVQHPRWAAWRTTWAHRVHCWQAPPELVSAIRPMLVLHGRLGLRLSETRTGVGIWTRDPGVLLDWLSEFDVISQRSSEAMPPTTLGL